MKARTQAAFVALWLATAASAEAQPYPPQQYPAPQYPQQRPPQYPPQQYPPQQRPAQPYPPQQYPAPQYPPQQRPPQYPAQPYPPQPYPPQQRPPQQYPPQQYPPQQYPAPPPQQRPPQQYPPQQYPPQQYPPQQYPPQQYPPQQYPPQQYPRPAPQYPPGGPYPAPQQQPGYPPGYVPPYVPPVPTQAPDPLLDSQQRYHQQLGAYRRTFVLPPPDPKKGRTAYVRLANLSKRHHDGLYFRFAGGFGALHDSAKSNRPLPSKADFGYEPAPFDGSGGGMGGATELSIGYTLAAGFSLGVGVFTAIAPSPTLDVNDPNTGSYLLKTTQIAVIGVLGDWYFFPSKGFHAQVSPGLGTLVSGAGQTENVDAEGNSTGPQAQAHTSVGLGLMFGVGYDFWVSDEWSLGFLGRFLYTSTSGDDDRGVSWTHHSYCPSLMVSATYN